MSYNTANDIIIKMMEEVGFEPTCNRHYSTNTNLTEDMCSMIKVLLDEIKRLSGIVGSQAPAFTPVVELTANYADEQGVAVVEPYASSNYIVTSKEITKVEIRETNLTRESTVKVSMLRDMSDEMIDIPLVIPSISHNKNMRNKSASGEGAFVKGFKCEYGQRGWACVPIVHQEYQAVDLGEASVMEAMNGVSSLANDVYFEKKTISVVQSKPSAGAVEIKLNTNVSITFATTSPTACYANIITSPDMKVGCVINIKLRPTSSNNNCRAIVTLNGVTIATMIKNVGEYPNGVKLTKTDDGFDMVFMKDGVVVDYTFRDRTATSLATIGELVTAAQQTANDAMNGASDAMTVASDATNIMNNPTMGLVAAHSKANTATTNITNINSRLNHASTGLSALFNKGETALSYITSVNNRLNNTTTGLEAAHSKAVAAQTAADAAIIDVIVEGNAIKKVRPLGKITIPFSYIKDVGLNSDKSLKVTKISTSGAATDASFNTSTGISDKPIGWDQTTTP